MGKHGRVVASFQQGPSWPLIRSKGADASNKGTDTANKGADNQNKGRASEPDADGDAVVRRIEANDAWQSRTARALEHLRSPPSAAQRRCRIVWDRLSHGRVSRGTSDVDDIPHDA